MTILVHATRLDGSAPRTSRPSQPRLSGTGERGGRPARWQAALGALAFGSLAAQGCASPLDEPASLDEASQALVLPALPGVGFIRNVAGGGCLAKDSPDRLRPCNSNLPRRLWRFEDNLIKSQDSQCLSADNVTNQVTIKLCANSSGWAFDSDKNTFRLLGTNKCLFGKENGADGDGVDVRDCSAPGPRFQWSLVKP